MGQIQLQLMGRRKPLGFPGKSTEFGYTLSHIFKCSLKNRVYSAEQAILLCLLMDLSNQLMHLYNWTGDSKLGTLAASFYHLRKEKVDNLSD